MESAMSVDASIATGAAEEIAQLLLENLQQLFFVDDRFSTRLPVAQLRVCGVLHRSARPMSGLSQELGVSLSAMTQIADRLERAGLVRRVAERSDRRVKQLQLTPRGTKMMRAREESRIARISAALARLSPEGQCRVRAALEELAEAARPDGQPATAAVAAVRPMRE
jgi:DNA-binding MarR family transcriptional regulator